MARDRGGDVGFAEHRADREVAVAAVKRTLPRLGGVRRERVARRAVGWHRFGERLVGSAPAVFFLQLVETGMRLNRLLSHRGIELERDLRIAVFEIRLRSFEMERDFVTRFTAAFRLAFALRERARHQWQADPEISGRVAVAFRQGRYPVFHLDVNAAVLIDAANGAVQFQGSACHRLGITKREGGSRFRCELVADLLNTGVNFFQE